MANPNPQPFFTEGHTHSAKPRKRRTEQALEAPDEQKPKKKSEKIDKIAVTETSKITLRTTSMALSTPPFYLQSPFDDSTLILSVMKPA